MTLRYRERHVLETVKTFILAELTTKGWVTAPRNFGTLALTVMSDIHPEDEENVQVVPNTLAISLGDVDEEEEMQMGGGLYENRLPIFFDVYAENGTIARAICNDIAESINRGKVITLQDFTTGTGVDTTEVIEFDEVVGPERPDASVMAQAGDFRKHWRVVKAFAAAHYQD